VAAEHPAKVRELAETLQTIREQGRRRAER